MIHTIWSGWARKTKQEQNKTNNSMLRYAILTQFDLKMKAERGEIVQHSCFIQTEKKHGPVAIL